MILFLALNQTPSSSSEVQISSVYRLVETAADYNSNLVKKTVTTAHTALRYSAAEANRPVGRTAILWLHKKHVHNL